jgi:hypothetical protein
MTHDQLEQRLSRVERELRLWRRAAATLGLGTLVAAPVWVFADNVTLPHTFVNGQVADADEVNANFAALNGPANALQLARRGDLPAATPDVGRLVYLDDVGIDSFTSLLLNMDGVDGGTTFTDASATGHVAEVGGATTQNDQAKFGTTSGLFVDDYLAFDDHPDFDFGTGDFTIDLWAYLNQAPADDHFFDGRAGNAGFDMRVRGGSGTVSVYDLTPNINAVILESNSVFPRDRWVHVALVRSGATMTLYLDGVVACCCCR